ncbi:MAG: 4-phosphoerythronate dehydrogenase [Candidatus Cryptobacteroides sp.]
MKLVIDKEIPFVQGVFEPYCEQVRYMNGPAIGPADIADADALLLKGRTRCSAALLDGSKVRMIATTTVGLEHIDLEYCNGKGIYVQNARGSTVGGVMNYVFSALYGSASRRSIDLSGYTIGIVGCGAVGSRIEAVARALGFKVLIEDPIRASQENPERYCSLDELLAGSDVVTLHCPLNDRTRGMCNDEFFSKMKFGAFFINTAHGAIVDEDALLRAIQRLGPVIIDCWKNEPRINLRLLDKVEIGTPNISGYSYQSKLAGSRIAVRSIARYFGITQLYDFFPKPDIEGMDAVHVDVIGKSQGQIASIFQYNYPIFTDDFFLRMDPSSFEDLRKTYKYRREFHVL